MIGASKAFRARLKLTDEHTARFQAWASKNFALSSMFRSNNNVVILVALTDRPRRAASFARTLRAVMQRLAIPTDARTLQGHWVSLLTEAEVLALCLPELSTSALPPGSQAASPPVCPNNADDEKVVILSR
jgi:hypothetical protein